MTSEKDDYIDMVPDYHHDLLSPARRNEFERELEKNEELRRELDEFRRFEKLYGQIDDETFEPSKSHLKRIFESIESGGEDEQPAPSATAKTPSIREHLQDIFRSLKRSQMLPWGLAAVQAVVLIMLLVPDVQQSSYQTLSGNQAALLRSGETYNIVFQPSTAEEEIRRLLLSVGAVIVSGPSPQGRYLIVVPETDGSEKKLDSLRREASVLFFEKSL